MISPLPLEARPAPLDRLPDGTYRVAGTRVGLDTVIEAYKHGQTPEEVVGAFDTLRLADVYALIAYYLDHAREVEDYLREYDASAEVLRRRIEATQPPRPRMKEQLLRRKAERERGNVPAGD